MLFIAWSLYFFNTYWNITTKLLENLLTKESQLLGSLLCNKEHKEFHIQETKYDKAIQKEFKIIKILFV